MTRTGTKPSGFTLLEMMVVLIIIGILASVFLGFGGSIFSQKDKQTQFRVRQLATMLEEFRTIEGAYPDDRLPPASGGSPANGNSEALCLAFFHPDYTGSRPDEDWLGNTDFDESTKSRTIFPEKALFELCDAWGNPLAYFESLHYESPASITAGPDEERFEQEVRAARSEKTGSWRNPNGFQIASAGSDGIFGTEDDITNYSDS